MKRSLSPAKSPLPKFQSDREAAEYFETHSVASVWNSTTRKAIAELEAGKGKRFTSTAALMADLNAEDRTRGKGTQSKHPGKPKLGGV